MTAISTPPRIQTHARWQRADVLWLVGLVSMAVALTWRAWADLAWLSVNDEESSHLLLVPMVVGYLIWQRWTIVLDTPPRLGILGLLTLALGIFVWEYGYRNDYRVGDHIGAVLVFAGTIACVAGDRFVLRFFPLFLILAFLIPVPYTVRVAIAIPLQRANAAVAHEFFTLLGIQVLREGSVLEINGQRVGVAEACNGMRSILAVFLVCYAMAFATRIRASARLLLLLAAPAIAMLANIIRLLLTTVAYGYGTQELGDILHDMLGWATIGVAFGFVWVVIALARWLMIPIDPPHSPRSVQSTAPLASPV